MKLFGKEKPEEELVRDCKKGKNSAHRDIYARYSSRMYPICLRYLKNEMDAEEVLINAFMRVFEKIDQFEGKGSFEGWIRKITVNEALLYLRKNKSLYLEVDIDMLNYEPDLNFSEKHLEAEDLLHMVAKLPPGYNAVFNLYAIEGYSHKEIADMLGISENTSKSQLSRARILLQKYIRESEIFFNRESVKNETSIR